MRRRAVLAVGAVAVVAAALAVTAVAASPSASIARATGPTRLPSSLQLSVARLCMSDLGSLLGDMGTTTDGGPQSIALTFGTRAAPGSFSIRIDSGSWFVEASRAGVTATGSKVALGGTDTEQSSVAMAIAQKTYDCVSQYQFADDSTPHATSSQLVQQYRYDTAVLWPCLRARGLKPGPAPSRQDFSDPFRAQGVDPFGELDASGASLRSLVDAVRACPPSPAYLH
jgi:hypothetical protein